VQDCLSIYNEAFARKLSLHQVLEGHEGCVNRVCWNKEGTLLASASDDRKVHFAVCSIVRDVG
jgi:WD40 repeat protein